MKPVRAFLLLAALACRAPGTGPVRLARGVAFALRAPASGPAFFASQEVVFHRPDGGTETFLTAVENDARRLSVVASTPLGMTLFTVQVLGGPDQGVAAQVDARVPLPPQFDLRLLPALIQLANWPLDELRKGLGPGLELTEAGPVRTLLDRGRVALTLTREGAAPPYRTVAVAVPSLALSLSIRTLEEQP